MNNEIVFHMPKGTMIKIQNFRSLTFLQVIQCFEQNCFYFSKRCIKNNLRILISGHEISREKYPFKYIIPGSTAEVVLTGNTVTIDYAGKEFNFSENEYAHDACDFIFKAFPEIEFENNIIIQNDLKKKKAVRTYELKSNEKYSIHIKCPYIFENITKISHTSIQHMDYFDKVSDAKNILSIIFSNNHELGPENIKIYGRDKREITDENKLLRDLKDENLRILFYIDYDEKSVKNKKQSQNDESMIRIHFIFEEDNSSFDEYFSLKTTVGEIESRLKTKFDTKDKITIEYEDKEEGEKSSFGRRMIVENIIEDIKTSTSEGKTINILYIKRIKPTKSSRPKSSFRPKLTKTADSNSDSDSKEKQRNQTKPKPKKTKIPTSNDNDDDDDDIETIKPKEKENKKTHSSLSKPDKKSPKQKKTSKNDNKSEKYEYYYNTNIDGEIKKIELPKGADVRELKKVIAKENDVDDLSNIKVIFAGKDLINKLILDELEIGDIPLYIYIRSLEDILLMTAKALVIKKEDKKCI